MTTRNIYPGSGYPPSRRDPRTANSIGQVILSEIRALSDQLSGLTRDVERLTQAADAIKLSLDEQQQ